MHSNNIDALKCEGRLLCTPFSQRGLYDTSLYESNTVLYKEVHIIWTSSWKDSKVINSQILMHLRWESAVVNFVRLQYYTLCSNFCKVQGKYFPAPRLPTPLPKIPFCFASELLLIPDKTKIKGEQRFRCISGWVIHLSIQAQWAAKEDDAFSRDFGF